VLDKGIASLVLSRLKAKGARYWIRVAWVVLLSFVAGPRIENYISWDHVRDRLHQKLTEQDPRALIPRYTRLVLIGDQEYWKGDELAGRRPINRHYLAELVNALDDANVKVIALDFDLRSADPTSGNESPHYENETKELVEAVLKAAQHRPVVLPKTIREGPDGYALDPDVYQRYGLCTDLRADGTWRHGAIEHSTNFPPQTGGNISCGYIALPFEKLLMPPQLEINDGRRVDSFSFAIAKAAEPWVARSQSERFVSYIPQKNFPTSGPVEAVFSAQDVLTRPEVRDKLAHEAVIVGGAWSTFAFGRGAPVDSHETPIGTIGGVLIHANFVEALLDGRTYPVVSERVARLLEVAFALATAIVLAVCLNFVTKLTAIIAMSALLVAIQYFTLHNFGIFLDASVLVLAVWVHSILEPPHRSSEG